MQKATLHFTSLAYLAGFAKAIDTGYLMNTSNLTLIGWFTDIEIQVAQREYEARLVETSDKAYTY